MNETLKKWSEISICILSVIGTLILAVGRNEAWFFYIVANIIAINLFLKLDLKWLMLVNIINLLASFYSLYRIYA